jgi:hypothetical protein
MTGKNGAPPNARAAAAAYSELGWPTVPIPPGGKGPVIKGWQHRQLEDVDAADYAGTGIGIILGEPSGGLVDVDLDCDEAIRVAPHLLPPTGMVHGRQSRPASHAWYRCHGARPAQFRDPVRGRKMLVELRSSNGDKGQQTVVPPSRHPSGEEITWWSQWPPEPSEVDVAELHRAVADVAAAALVVRHHPGDGARHEFALRLAGMLAHGGYPRDRAEHLVVAVSRAAGDQRQEDRAHCVASTYDKHITGESTAGGPLLAELLGEHGDVVVKALRDWLGLRAGREMDQLPPRVSDRPIIVVSTDQRAVVSAAEEALALVGGVYVRGRSLVSICHDRSAPEWLRRPDGTPVIAAIPREQLRERIGAAAAWLRPARNGVEPCLVPMWVVSTLLDRGEWSFAALEAISDAPVMRADGTIHDTPGYDEQTRILYEPAGRWPAMAVSPTQEDASRALDELLGPFADFPYVALSDRSATAALVLSMVARGAINGCVPLFVVGAPVPGAGKGLLVDAAAIIATGRAAPKMAAADNDETRKRLLAIAIESPAIVSIDNVEGQLGSAALAMALTAGVVTDRVLGQTEVKTASLRSVFAATGNNIQLRGDLGRRVVPIDIDPELEHPEDRDGFRHTDLLEHVARERPRLFTAAMTILRAFHLAGRPQHDRPPKGSYVPWDRLVRGAIIWAGGADPLAGTQRIRDQGDDDLDRLRELLAAWHEKLEANEMTTAEVVQAAGETGRLYDAIAAYSRGKPDSRSLGYTLRRLHGRIAGGLVVRRGTRADRRAWSVAAADSARRAPDASPSSPSADDRQGHHQVVTSRNSCQSGDDGDQGDGSRPPADDLSP